MYRVCERWSQHRLVFETLHNEHLQSKRVQQRLSFHTVTKQREKQKKKHTLLTMRFVTDKCANQFSSCILRSCAALSQEHTLVFSGPDWHMAAGNGLQKRKKKERKKERKWTSMRFSRYKSFQHSCSRQLSLSSDKSSQISIQSPCAPHTLGPAAASSASPRGFGVSERRHVLALVFKRMRCPQKASTANVDLRGCVSVR